MRKTNLIQYANQEDAFKELEQHGIPVWIVFEANMAVVELAQNFPVEQLKYSEEFFGGQDQFKSENAEIRDQRMWLAEIWQKHEKDRGDIQNKQKGEWIDRKHSHDLNLTDPQIIRENAKLSTGKKYLSGMVNVGLMVVSGPSSDLQMDETDVSDSFYAAYAGLLFLAQGAFENEITFIITQRMVTIDIPNRSSGFEYQYWMPLLEASMAAIDYPNSLSGADQYIKDLASLKGVDWAYLGFITKYNISAYTSIHGYNPVGDDYIFVKFQYFENLLNHLYHTFAHETCHIFCAQDEYDTGSSEPNPCSVKSGVFNTPNRNYETCPPPLVDCLMKRDYAPLCFYTRRQMGMSAWYDPISLNDAIGANSNAQASLDTLDGNLCMMYRGVYNDDDIYFTQYINGKWQAYSNLGSSKGMHSKTGPTIAEYLGQLVCVYRGSVGDEAIYCSYYNGNWTDYISLADKIGANSANSPALAQYGNDLFMVYRGSGDDTALYFTTFDGTSWNEITNLNVKIGSCTALFPALCSFNGILYLAYTDLNSDLCIASYKGSTWKKPINISKLKGVKPDSAPSLAVYDNRLYMFYVDASTVNICYVAYDGTKWSREINIGEDVNINSVNIPAAKSFKQSSSDTEKMYVVYRGYSNDEVLYMSYFEKAYSPGK